MSNSSIPLFVLGFSDVGTCQLFGKCGIETVSHCSMSPLSHPCRYQYCKVLGLLKGTFGVDLPSAGEEDAVEVEFVSEEKEEEQLPKTGTTSHAAAQLADRPQVSKSSQSPSTSQK